MDLDRTVFDTGMSQYTDQTISKWLKFYNDRDTKNELDSLYRFH